MNWSGGVVPNSTSAAAVINSGQNNPVILNASATVSTLTLGLGDSLDQTAGLLSLVGGSISNSGDLQLASQLQAGGDLTLSGGGTLTLSGGGQIGTDGYGRTLYNASTIVGAGVIGSNAGALYQNLSLNNSGTINANSAGDTLSIQGNGSSMTNTGLLEATGGGTLSLSASAALVNAGGAITAAGAGSTVVIDTQIQGGVLTTSGGGVIETGGGGAYLNGSTSGDITLSNGSTYSAGTSGLTAAVGTLNLGTGVGPGATFALTGQLQLNGGDLIFAGPGTVTMSGPSAQIGGDGYGRTLINQATIEGAGVIGSNTGALYQNLSLNNTGTIDADAMGDTLSIQGTGATFTNDGLLEATQGGILTLATSAPVANSSGFITASGAGSTVIIDTQVQGGVLTTSGGGVMETGTGAYLNGVVSGPITLSNASTYTAGTSGLTAAVGTLDLGTGAGPGATLALTGQLQLNGGDLTFAGPGVVVMSGGAQIGGDGYGRTLNNGVTIEGTGVIGSNVGALYQGLSLNNYGTIDADVSGSTLSIQSTGSTMTNSNLLEATGGGTLNLAASAPLDNAGGTITADGAGSTVTVNTQIEGGLFNTSDGGVIETGSGGAYLNGASSSGPITFSNGSAYTAGASALTAAVGTLNLGTGAGAGATFALTGQLQLDGGDLTFSGPGVVTLSGADAQIGGDGYARTLTNQVKIEGTGVIGSNNGALYQSLSLNNTGTIDADSSGNVLSIQGTGSTMINNGLLEASGGGLLVLAASTPLSNMGGSITATGAGSTVTIDTQIQGGVLNTSGGGVIETGTGAYLNGAVSGPITLSDGSTYTAGTGGLTAAVGTLDFGAGATLALTGQLQLTGGDLTFSGPGTVALSGDAQIGGDGYARTLNNSATIEGSGLVGSNVGALYSSIGVVNQAAGVLLADISGQTLTVAGTGGLTNDGVMQADAGATLNATQGFTNFAAGTLTGGTYNMYSGVIQINAFGVTGGEITTNAANIRLNGATALLSDGAGLNALSTLSTNVGGANLIVENGNEFATAAPSTFTNNGGVQVGSGSTFTTLADYAQSGASSSTRVDGTLTPGSGEFALAGGVLTGSGAVAGEVTNTGGVVDPGDGIGTLHALAYTQGAAGTLEIDISGASSFDVLDVAGAVNLSGLLDPVLKDGFTPTIGETFTFLDYTSRSGVFSGIENDVFDGGRYMWDVTYNATDAVLTLERGPSISAAPEPSSWMLMLMGVGGLGAALRRSKRKPRARSASGCVA